MTNRKKKGKECHWFSPTHSLKVGLQKFGKKGKEGAHKEAKQLNDRTVRKPAQPNDLTKDEKHKAMESLIFLSEKIEGTMTGRTRASGYAQRSCIPKEEASSQMVAIR